jgi:hypothetical protein
MPTTRRHVLRTLGATAGAGTVAGCQTIVGDDDPDDASVEIDVEDVTVRPGVVALDTADSYGVFGGREEQFLVAEVAVGTPDSVEPSDLVVETDDGEFDTTVDVGGVGGRLAEFGEAHGSTDDGTGWVAARLPKPLDADRAALAWDGGEYPVGESALERLNRPPTDFDVVLEAPRIASVGDEVTVTVSLVNTGGADGAFVAALNRVGPQIAYAPETAVVLPVEAGEYAEWEYTYALDDPEVAEMDDPVVRFHLPWRDGSSTREIDVETH